MKPHPLIFFCLIITACSGPFSPDAPEAKRQLLEIAPIGSDIRPAASKLESLGFDCRWQEQQEFAGLSGKKNYLYCNKQVMVKPLTSRRWQLALIHKNHIVTDAKFGISLTGL